MVSVNVSERAESRDSSRSEGAETEGGSAKFRESKVTVESPGQNRAWPGWPVTAAAISALTLWGGTAVANKIAVRYVDAMTAGILRSAIAAVVATGIAFVLRLPFPSPLRDRALLLISGIASFALWPMLFSLGIGFTSASHAGLILAVIPVFTGLIACAWERRLPARLWWWGSLIALVGTALLIFSREATAVSASPAPLKGDLIVLSGILVCAIGYVAGGKLSPRYGTWATTFWGLALALTVQVPALVLLAPRTDWPAIGFAGWGAIAYLAFASSLIGYAAWFWALGRGGIARIATWQFAQPVITLFLAALILGESIAWSIMLAATIILGGTALAQNAQR